MHSLIMTKQEIASQLNTICKHTSIKMPSSLTMSIEDGCLTINIPSKELVQNMQTDSAAFEGWALVLKNWIKDINKVIIKWDCLFDKNLTEKQHYQRFLYRAKRFSDAYSWVNIHFDNQSCLDNLIIDSCDKIVLNAPSKPRSRNFDVKKNWGDYSESQLEKFILSNEEVQKRFYKAFNLRHADNQLPVGVFNGEVRISNKIFTGGKSAIDIWGINKENSFCIFELKKPGNRKIGALSEMLFYSFIIQDIINGKFSFFSKHPFLKEVKECKKVKCYLLAPHTHPLINQDVFALLNRTSSNIEYLNAKITNEFEFESV